MECYDWVIQLDSKPKFFNIEEAEKKVVILEPTASNWFENNEDPHPQNVLDGNKDTFFGLQVGTENGYW